MRPAAAKLREWRENPVAFARECLRVEPDAWQCDVLAAFPHQPRIAMKACKGPGKSAVESWIGWNFLATRPYPKVVATSITGANLKDGLWAEMALWQGRSAFLKEAFTWSAERIVNNNAPENWFMSARTWVVGADPSQQANTLAGIHADYVLFILDESGGIPSAVMSAAEGGMTTGVETHILQGGNPTHLSGPLYDACTKDRARWFVVEVTGDPDDPKRSPRIDIENARASIASAHGGRENPWVMVNILGKFPPQQSNALLGVEEVTEATQRSISEHDYHDEPKILGVDVARFGDDRSVLLLRQGRAVFKPKVFRNLDTQDLASEVVRVIGKNDPDATFVDMGAMGPGVVDRCRALGFRVIGVNFGGKALDAGFVNKRSEMWGKAAEWIRAGGCLPDDQDFISELSAPTYEYNAKNQVVLESKEDVKKRGFPSPDKADALVLTFAQPVAHRGLATRLQRGQPKDHGAYDPFAQGAS